MLVWFGHSCPTASGRVLFSVPNHLNLGCADAATSYPQDFQMRAYVEGGDGFLEKLGRDSGVHQRGEEHVAADSGKAVEVGDAHRKIVVGRWSLVKHFAPTTGECAKRSRGILKR